MKRIVIFTAFLAAFVAAGFDFAGVLDQFTAQPDGDGITLNWASGIETGIASYSVQRADISSVNDFQSVSTVTAKGNYSNYQYHDNHISGIAHAGSANQTLSDAYKYRLQINLASGDVSYSQTVSVTKPASGVRRTWGMIKEMFH